MLLLLHGVHVHTHASQLQEENNWVGAALGHGAMYECARMRVHRNRNGTLGQWEHCLRQAVALPQPCDQTDRWIGDCAATSAHLQPTCSAGDEDALGRWRHFPSAHNNSLSAYETERMMRSQERRNLTMCAAAYGKLLDCRWVLSLRCDFSFLQCLPSYTGHGNVQRTFSQVRFPGLAPPSTPLAQRPTPLGLTFEGARGWV